MNCQGRSDIQKIPGCDHRLCLDCISKGFEMGNESPPFYCFANNCNNQLSDHLVLKLLTPDSDKKRRIFRTLKIDGGFNIICPNCQRHHFVDDYFAVKTCECGTGICTRCSRLFHGDIPCMAAENNQNKYQKIECLENDVSPEFRSHYYNALSLFTWDMHPAKKQELMKKFKTNLQVKKVFKIFSPNLVQRYEMVKAELMKRGIEPDEKYVFHGTKDNLYDEICQNGFKIGGIDIDINIGNVYGYGVYTATDPTQSIVFYSNKKIIICKAITGNKKNQGITDIEEFKRNMVDLQFQSVFVDFKGNQSNYYVFFRSDLVIPCYYIEYD